MTTRMGRILLLSLFLAPFFGHAKTCSELLAPQFLNPSNEQLKIVERHAQQVVEEMAAELNPLQRSIFLKAIRQAQGKGLTGAGLFKHGKIYLNVFNDQHPLGWISLVHEAQHVQDEYPGLGLLGRFLPIFQPNHVNFIESKAFSREYDLLKRLILDPDFDEDKAIALVPRMQQQPLPYDIDEPVENGFGEPSEEFAKNPQKFLSRPGARQRLEALFSRMSDYKFLQEMHMARTLTKEEYINQRLKGYRERAAFHRKMAHILWMASAAWGSAVSAPLICLYFGI